jgi:hypothetical protein
MSGRKPDQFVLHKEDRPILQDLLSNGHTSQRVARRAHILLCRAEAHRVTRLADKAAQNRSTVWRVCERYCQCGLEAALYDAPVRVVRGFSLRRCGSALSDWPAKTPPPSAGIFRTGLPAASS